MTIGHSIKPNKFFDELIISKQIRALDKFSPIQSIYFVREYVDKIDIPRKEYIVKFEDESETVFVKLTDIPFHIEDGIARYDILFETLYGRIYAHEKDYLNNLSFKTKYKDFAEFLKDYNKREEMKVGR